MGHQKILPHGWHGSGVGNNWCNLCRCNDGSISCQKRKCGTDGLMEGTECSHTVCGTKILPDGKQVVLVNHSHHENFGRLHHCAYMKSTDTCRCHCFGNTFAELEHGPRGNVRRDLDIDSSSSSTSAGGNFQDTTGTGINNDVQRFTDEGGDEPSSAWAQK